MSMGMGCIHSWLALLTLPGHGIWSLRYVGPPKVL